MPWRSRRLRFPFARPRHPLAATPPTLGSRLVAQMNQHPRLEHPLPQLATRLPSSPPLALLLPGPELARLPGSFAHAVDWTRQCPRLAPLGLLDRIRSNISTPGLWGARIQESTINVLAVEWVSGLAKAVSRDALVNAVGDQIANTWGPGATQASTTSSPSGPTPPRPSCWIESALQRHLLDLRLRAGLLKEVKVYKRKRDASSDRVGGEADGEREEEYDDASRANRTLGNAQESTPESTSSLMTDHLSFVSATLSSASQASAQAGLNKPDLVILGQTPPTTNTRACRDPIPTRVLTPTVVSLVCERKDDSSDAAEGFAQAIAYALTAASVYGTYFGLYWYQNRFVRIVVASEDLLVIESSAGIRLDLETTAASSPSQSRATSIRLSSLLAVLTNQRAINMCLHSFWDSDTGENDDQSIQTLWELFMHCLALVLQHPTSCPRLARPAGWDSILSGLDQHASEVRDSSDEQGWDDLAFAAYRGHQTRLRNAAALRRAEMSDDDDSIGSDSDNDKDHPPDGDANGDKDHDTDGGDMKSGRGSGTAGDSGPEGSRNIDGNGGDGGGCYPGGSNQSGTGKDWNQDQDIDLRIDADGSFGPGLDQATMDKVLEMKWAGKEVYLDSLIAPVDPARPTAIDLIRLAHPSARVMLVDPDVMDALVADSDRELQERLHKHLAQVDAVDLATARASGRAWADRDDNSDGA